LTVTLASQLHSISYINNGANITLTGTSPLRWEIADLAPGEGGIITITATPQTELSNGFLITNTAQMSALMGDGITLNRTRAKQSQIIDIPPTISDILEVHTQINEPTDPILFTINDEDTPIDELILSAASANLNLIPNDNITFRGDGMNRTMIITPTENMTGSSLITVTVSDQSSQVFDTFSVTVENHQVYLPLLFKSCTSCFIPPGAYPANSCGEASIYASSTGDLIGIVEECVTGVEVRINGDMQFNYSWGFELYYPSITKYSDNGNTNMFIRDNLGNRYDHFDVGGAAASTTTVYDGDVIDGWFLFPPAKNDALIFTFYDDDTNIVLDNIDLSP